MTELKKPSAKGVVSLSLVLLISFIMLAIDKKGWSDAREIIYLLVLLGFSACIIWTWLKYLKDYVNFAIEQKFKEMNNRTDA